MLKEICKKKLQKRSTAERLLKEVQREDSDIWKDFERQKIEQTY